MGRSGKPAGIRKQAGDDTDEKGNRDETAQAARGNEARKKTAVRGSDAEEAAIALREARASLNRGRADPHPAARKPRRRYEKDPAGRKSAAAARLRNRFHWKGADPGAELRSLTKLVLAQASLRAMAARAREAAAAGAARRTWHLSHEDVWRNGREG